MRLDLWISSLTRPIIVRGHKSEFRKCVLSPDELMQHLNESGDHNNDVVLYLEASRKGRGAIQFRTRSSATPPSAVSQSFEQQ